MSDSHAAAPATKVRIDPSKYGYTVDKNYRTASGRSTIDNGDKVAVAMRGMTLEGVFIMLQANGGEVKPEWQSKNPGMQRMAAGNVLRRIVRKLEAEGKELIVPDEAKATITKVDPDAAIRKLQERYEAKAAKVRERDEARARREEAKAERDAAQAEARNLREAEKAKAAEERAAKAATKAAAKATPAQAEAAPEAKPKRSRKKAETSTAEQEEMAVQSDT